MKLFVPHRHRAKFSTSDSTRLPAKSDLNTWVKSGSAETIAEDHEEGGDGDKQEEEEGHVDLTAIRHSTGMLM